MAPSLRSRVSIIRRSPDDEHLVAVTVLIAPAGSDLPGSAVPRRAGDGGAVGPGRVQHGRRALEYQACHRRGRRDDRPDIAPAADDVHRPAGATLFARAGPLPATAAGAWRAALL